MLEIKWLCACIGVVGVMVVGGSVYKEITRMQLQSECTTKLAATTERTFADIRAICELTE